MVEQNSTIKLDGHWIEMTRPDKVLFPESAITKRDLVEYYERVSPWILPHLASRPLTLERYPDAIEAERIIQKSAKNYYPDWIRTATVRKVGGTVCHVLCKNEATLAYLANHAAITLHPWLSRIQKPDYPDAMIFDLDPSSEDFTRVRETARNLRERLEQSALPAYLKATGSRGLHVVVPVKPELDFGTVRACARHVVEMVVREDPRNRTMEQRRSARSRRFFLDLNRNAYAQTAVAPYGVRARPGAPVAVPIHWSELENRGFRSDRVTVRTIFRRLETIEDPWKDMGRSAVSLRRLSEQLALGGVDGPRL